MKDAIFRPAPFWFLNHQLEEKELTWQLEKMKEAGLGGAVLHARHGLKTPYFSEGWFEALEVCIKKAEKLGMILWLYDEYNWPSGPAGGKITEEFPELRMRYLYLEERQRVKAGKEVKIRLSSSAKIALVTPIDKKGGLLDFPRSVVDLSSSIGNGVFKGKVPPACQEYELFIFSLSDISAAPFANSHYLDLLNPKAVRKFIQVTHKEYEKRFKKYFGKTILGIFTDEPAAFFGKPFEEVTYTPHLFGEFQRKKGYNLKKCLPALFLDTEPKEEREKIRIDYYETLSFLYCNSFFKLIYNFCEKNKIASIGHVLLEGDAPQVKYQLDFFETARYMHYTGVDFLANNSGLNSRENMVGPKFASSAGHLFGKERIMTETSAVIGWDYDLARLKRLIDWQLALGINYIIPHAFFYSIQGFRRGESPPDESWRAPFYSYHRKLADYTALTTKIFTGGRHLSRIGIVYPNRSMWAKHNPGTSNEADEIWNMLVELSRNLFSFHYEYDYISERLIQEGKVWKGRLQVSDHQFQLLILPGCEYLEGETVNKLKALASQGGRLILLKCGDKIKELLSREAKSVEGLKPEDIEINPMLRIEPPEKGKEIISYAYAKGNDTFYLLFNDGDDKEVNIFVPKGNLYLLSQKEKPSDEFSIYRLESKKSGDWQSLSLHFYYDEAKILKLSSKEIKAERLIAPTEDSTVLTFSGEWEFKPLDVNNLPLKEWHQVFVFPEDPWASHSHQYSTSFEVQDIPENIFLVLDGLKGEKVWGDKIEKGVIINLNGEQLNQFPNFLNPYQGKKLLELAKEETIFSRSDWLDHYFYKIKVKLRKGKNDLVISASEELYEAVSLCGPLYIIGDFSVVNNTIVSQRTTVKTGDWTEHGYPYYSGKACYSQRLKVPPFKRAFLFFPSLKNGVRVVINGQEAGIVAWNPYRIEVTEYLKVGENLFTFEVANTMYNLIAAKSLPSGLLESPRIILER